MKKFLHSLMICLIAFGISSCDNTDDIDIPDKTVISTYNLSKGYGYFKNHSETYTDRLVLTLSNLPGEPRSNFQGPGNMVSMDILLPSGNGDKLYLEPGTYKFSASSEDEYTITKSENTFFANVDNSHKKSSYKIKAGMVTVVDNGQGVYSIDGQLYGSNDQVFNFIFESEIIIEDKRQEQEETPPPGEENTIPFFDNASVTYTADPYRNGCFNYTLNLTNSLGQEINVEISAPATNYHSNIAEGEYYYSDSRKDAYTIVASDNNYYIEQYNGGKIYFEGGRIAIELNSDEEYEITGWFTRPNEPEFEFEFTGELPIDKAVLNFRMAPEVYASGNLDQAGYQQFHYEANFKNGTSGTGEELWLELSTPLKLYNEFYPIPSGTFTVVEEILGDWMINADDFPYDCHLRFTNETGGGSRHLLREGSVTLNYDESRGTYSFDGVFVTEVEHETQNGTIVGPVTEEEGKRTEVHFTYNGAFQDYHTYYNTGPRSKLTRDIQMVEFTQALFFYYGEFWYDEGAQGKSAVFDVWFGNEGADFNTNTDIDMHYMYIMLNVPTWAPQDELPLGTYDPDMYFRFEPYTFMPGHILMYTNIMIGSGYLTGGESDDRAYIWAPFGYTEADPGHIIIKKDSDNPDDYIVTVNCYDDKGRTGNRITGGYEGPIINADELEAAAGSMKMFSDRYMTREQRAQRAFSLINERKF